MENAARQLKRCAENPAHIWMADLDLCPYCHFSQEARIMFLETSRRKGPMPQAAVAVRPKTHLARPLKVLVPLIQEELAAGNSAGIEHYRAAGEMLIEARDQVPAGKFGAWLSKNFELSKRSAYYYMKLAERIADEACEPAVHNSLHSITRPDVKPARHAWRPVFAAAEKVAVDTFAEVRQERVEETRLHRELALELIDLGFRALATRLHPDRGGSKDAMRRLNRVRDELKSVAETRRFE